MSKDVYERKALEMAALPLTLVVQDYAYLAPLFLGDVPMEGVELRGVRAAGAPERSRDDSSVEAGELSFSWYLRRTAANDCPFVGLPFFVLRSFRHRSFFVRRGSPLRALTDLEGRRVGTNGWANTGNLWSRAILREAGVRLERLHWCLGSVDGEPFAPSGVLPAFVRREIPGRCLADLLAEGELDAVMHSTPPALYHDASSPIIRLLPDYQAAEQGYYRRTGIYPGTHIVGVRRTICEAHPWLAGRLFDALESSKRRWLDGLRRLPMTMPWLMPLTEQTDELLGRDWNPSGVEPNRAMIKTACEELFAQQLVTERLAPERAFAEFSALAAASAGGGAE
jgi:4,5-dihydroxyphthalate decarboxylase